MQLGLIARADNSGLGVQTFEFFRHMQPAKTLVIDVGHLYDDRAHTNKWTDRTRYPGAIFAEGWIPDRATICAFLEGLDVVFTAETTYHPHFIDIAHSLNVRVVIQPNWEFYDPRQHPDLWAVPTTWHYDDFPEPKTLLPVPIATDRFLGDFGVFPPLAAGNLPKHFLHVVGRPAVEDRNGTRDLLEALEHVTAEVRVTIRCQQGGYVTGLKPRLRTPKNVTLEIDPGDIENYWDLYTGDVMIMPRRFGGLCLPVNEALGAGMPVIMPDVSPNEWLPTDWLVPAGWQKRFLAKQHVDVYGVNPIDLARKIDQFATDPEFYLKARDEAQRLRAEYSWETLKPRYEEVLHG